LKHKNVDILVEAVAILAKDNPSRTCCIVGDGPEKESITTLIQKLDLSKNITLVPFVEDHKMLISFMKSAGVFVLPSSREGFGIVVLEANACGKQVITVDEPDNLAVYLKQGDNIIVTQLDAGGIATVIKQTLTEKNKFNMDFLGMYNWDQIIQKTEEVYRQ
jgi:glycosyltransferase involved in cell wall biosynthesis